MTREEANRIDQLLASYTMLDEKIDAARKDIKEIAASTHHMSGRFDEHVRNEEEWQQRVEATSRSQTSVFGRRLSGN